ncbi:alpha-hydroxy acid oxidase [Devosia sp.]|uniref:alpha-hydroxy acid oxidase n=1 Tax=Devosia sp. TaxID=1871048 RepID=UPI002B002046|nr:alpha-hydroxy acid oxidase [Devosia sp.]
MLAANIDDYRIRARRRLPRMFFDYLDGGSFGEVTLRRNRNDFDTITIEQRILRDVAVRDHEASFLGRNWSAPLMLAPLGFCGMFSHRGEIKAARAAERAGIPFCLSTMSITGLAEVAKAVSERPVFQSYVFRDRDLSLEMLDAAQRLGAPTLVLTVDANVSGIRERDTRNGFRTATRLGPRALADLALHPRWCLQMAPGGVPQLGNIAGRKDYGHGVMAQASRLSAQIDPSLTWKDVAWLRQQWKGRLVVKGILSVPDAREAVMAGADAIVVSNHGGRQLDGACSSVASLPPIVKAIEGEAEILLDSGIRRGSDVFKALALGADAVLLGRAYAYGLAADGERGVAGVIRLIRSELDITMALSGVHSLAELRADGPSILRHNFAS